MPTRRKKSTRRKFTIEAFIQEVLGAGDFSNAHEIMQQYDGPTVPDLADFMEGSFSGVPADDTARAAAGYRVALALFQVFTSFPDASARHWKESGLGIALAALAHLPATPGLEENIRLLVGVGDFYSKEDSEDTADVLVRVIECYEGATRLVTPEVDAELAITTWGVLGNLNVALFKDRTAELDGSLDRSLSHALPLDEAFYEQTVDLDEIGAAHAEQRQQLNAYQDEAVRCYERALDLNKGMYGRAYTLIDFAQLLAERGTPDDVARAAGAFSEALNILDLGTDKDLYARTKMNLAKLYRKHGEALGDESMEKTRQCLEEASHLMQEGPWDELWEVTHDLSLVYDLLPSGEEGLNRDRAVELMKEAIRVGEEADLDKGKLLLSYAMLGILYERSDRLDEARPWLEKAYELLETERWTKGFEPFGMLETLHDVYRCLTRVQLRNKQVAEAFVTASRGRARYLTEALAYRYATPCSGLPQELWLRATQGRNADAEARGEDETIRSRYVAVLEEMEQQSSAAAHILKLEPVTAADVAGSLKSDQALLALYPTRESVVAFVVRPAPCELAVQAVPVSRKSLSKLLQTVVTEWIVAYEDFRWEGLPTQDRLSNLEVALEGLIAQVSDALDFSLVQSMLGSARHLLIVAHHPLQFVPIHALRLESGQELGDAYDVSYLPATAAGVLPGVRLIDREQLHLAISNPRPHPPWHLAYSALETKACSSFFERALLHEGKDATRFKVLKGFGEAPVLHFSCHGVHDFQNISRIRLLLAGQESLTVDDIFWRGFDEMAARLVVLSACESGLADALKLGDEFINFPGFLLRAGVQSIVYSLWQVEERATALILFVFYKKLVEESLHPAAALRLAQRWLRDATGEQLADTGEEMLKRAGNVDLPAGFRSWLQRLRKPDRLSARPYSHPYYWAAFCHMGT